MKHIGTGQMTYQAALQKIEQARAEQWEELDLSGMGNITGVSYLPNSRSLNHQFVQSRYSFW
jgi:hypothetical protein